MRRLAGSVMLLAALAFLQLGVSVAVSQAAAAAGFMPEPAVTLNGSTHFHGDLSRHVHVHTTNDAEGHVHDHAHENSDDGLKISFCAAAAAIIPAVALNPDAAPLPQSVIETPARTLVGFDPGELTHPPSTPSIA